MSATETCYGQPSLARNSFHIPHSSLVRTSHSIHLNFSTKHPGNSLVRISARGSAFFDLRDMRMGSHFDNIRFEDAVLYLLF